MGGMDTGKLRIGDNWNAITIIALSQNNPLKAVAEFVENSIDARAQHITITRGKDKGIHYLRFKDDGEGIQRDKDGIPDFQYVATHVCDSIKRQLKQQGAAGIQGEFGIGLLSFWTVGEELILASAGADGKVYQMHMRKGDPSYQITHKKVLFPERGAELTIRKILPGIKQFSGEKIQWYLAAELRDRIRNSGVQIKVIDRAARAEFKVEPRKFKGRLLHELAQIIPPQRELYLEIYLAGHDQNNGVGLYRSGTRVLENLARLSPFEKAPWTSGYLEGIIDAPYLSLTPGSRGGIIHDAALARLVDDLASVEQALVRIIEEQQRAEEERASRDILRCVQKALREALLSLPAEEYDWFNVRGREEQKLRPPRATPSQAHDALLVHENTGTASADAAEEEPAQKEFFDYAGPLFSLKIAPASSVVPVGGTKNLRAIARDRTHRLVESGVSYHWEIIDGEGELENATSEIVTFHAVQEPGLTRLKATARQSYVVCQAEALVTVTDSLLPESKSKEATRQGIPSYTYQKAPGELWRAKYQAEQNVVVINNGHRDFVFASRNKALKLRYICRLFAKELVLRNFIGIPPDQLLERLIELSLYTEENLR
jgi:hypothetical protein